MWFLLLLITPTLGNEYGLSVSVTIAEAPAADAAAAAAEQLVADALEPVATEPPPAAAEQLVADALEPVATDAPSVFPDASPAAPTLDCDCGTLTNAVEYQTCGCCTC